MSEDQRQIASFVVRFTQHLWKDPQEGPRVQWRGNIRHVQGDEQLSFTDLSEALAFIQRHLTELTMSATAGEAQPQREQALRESFQIWNRLAATYSDLLLDAVQAGFSQSGVLQEQVDRAVAQALEAWQLPAAHSLSAEALAQVNVQLEALAEKLAKLEEVLDKGDD